MKPTRRTFLKGSLGAGLSALAGRAFAQAGHLEARLLASGFRGEIVTPGSPRYAEARRRFVFNPRRPSMPLVVAICSDEDDVRRALAFARQERLEFAVCAGGHDLQAASICDGMVIDLSGLRALEVDAARRTVRIGAGVRAGELNAALTRLGLAAALGCAGQVGVTGLILGGGMGWLVGRHGAACDHLVAARLVSADGQVLSVSREEHPDLLWALRGGGGNFGIVTEMTLAVHPVPQAIQGMVALRLGDAGAFLRNYRDYVGSAGDDLDLETYLFPAESGPMAFIKVCYYGEPREAEARLGPLRRLAGFAADDLAVRPYTGAIDPSGEVVGLFRPAAMPRRGGDVPGLHVGSASLAMDDRSADIIAERLRSAQGAWTFGLGHYVHGAATRVPARHSAMLRVDGSLTSYFIASWRRPEEAETRMAWVDDAVSALREHTVPTYINYMTTGDPAEVRRAYGPGYGRLAATKRRYDPGNLFRRNRNILPAAG